MKTLRSLALLTGAAAMALGTAASAESAIAQRGEARLARMLEGRTPGQPVGCISAMNSNKLQVIDGVAVVYDAGKTIYVARPTDPHMLRQNDVPVFERYNASRLCAIDPIRTIDRYDHYPTGVVFLQDFVPYTRQG